MFHVVNRTWRIINKTYIMTGEKDIKNITDDRKKWWAKEIVHKKTEQNYKLIQKDNVYC